MGKMVSPLFSVAFGPILFIRAGNEDMHKISDEFELWPDRTTDYGGSCPWASKQFPIIFDRIIIKVAGNQDWYKSLVEFDFGPNQTTHFGVTCPWVMKIPHFWTLISLKPVGQSWSNFTCSITGLGERLRKVLGADWIKTCLVWLLFYGHSTHFRSFLAWSVNPATLVLGKPPRQFTSN